MNELLPWVHALGWTLVHFLWQGLAVGVAFAAVRVLLPKSNCRARYAAGLGALALLAAWPAATLVALWPRVDAAADATAVDLAVAISAGSLQAPGFLGMLDHALPWLVAIWTVGVLVMAGRALREWHSLCRIARRWATEHPELEAMVATLTARFGFVRRVRVLVSTRVDTPMLFGWIKPVVLLPTSVALGFPRQQIELILAHELGHLRRYDHLVNLAQTVLETLLFYHPVVHWISNEVRNERELCCDELVLRLTAGEPREYARTLASLEELRHAAGSLALAANGGELLERVRRIIGMPAPRLATERRASGRWLLAAFGIGAALLIAQRIGHVTGQTFMAPRIAASWLGDFRHITPSSPSTSMDAARIELPRLRIATLAAAAAPAGAAAVNAVPAAPVAAVASPEQQRMPAPAMPVVTAPPAPEATAAPAPAAAASLAASEVPVAARTPVDAPAPPSAPVAKPVAVHTVAPAFPPFARRLGSRVEASFSIAADGSVRDIRFVGSADGPFEREAERALRQWRFDPRSLPADASTARYRQDFVFAPPVHAGGEHDRCILSTGSRICRDIDSGTSTKVYAAEF